MAEAALALCTVGAHRITGRSVTSAEVLAELDWSVRTLDGANLFRH
jgi:hypothetical protein